MRVFFFFLTYFQYHPNKVILSQKGLFTAYLDIKLTAANTHAGDMER